MVLTKGDAGLVIDPGAFTMPLTDVSDVVAIVITHEHADHWTSEQLTRLLAASPKARIFAPAGVVKAASDFNIETVTDGDELTVDPFTLKFFGKDHAVIHDSIPIVDNIALLVDGLFYYAGDSFTLPEVEVDTLAVPTGAPWLKIAEVIDFVDAVKPRRAFPVHEAVLSVIGQRLSNERVEAVTVRGGGEFFALGAGDTLDL
jgi:L-ascorbate metabolism protein UlaG (beta-lactamase superfamily)